MWQLGEQLVLMLKWHEDNKVILGKKKTPLRPHDIQPYAHLCILMSSNKYFALPGPFWILKLSELTRENFCCWPEAEFKKKKSHELILLFNKSIRISSCWINWCIKKSKVFLRPREEGICCLSDVLYFFFFFKCRAYELIRLLRVSAKCLHTKPTALTSMFLTVERTKYHFNPHASTRAASKFCPYFWKESLQWTILWLSSFCCVLRSPSTSAWQMQTTTVSWSSVAKAHQ